jgi:hypothetical protein
MNVAIRADKITGMLAMFCCVQLGCSVKCPPGTRDDGEYCRHIDDGSGTKVSPGTHIGVAGEASVAVQPTAGADINVSTAGGGSSDKAVDGGSNDGSAAGAGGSVNTAGAGSGGGNSSGTGAHGGGGGSGGSNPGGCTPNICGTEYPCELLGTDYTCRGQFADWPPAYVSSAFSVSSNGTIKDSRSGLVWQGAVPASYAPTCSEKGDSSSSVMSGACNWQHAKDYCTALSLADGGWRLPTKAELESLVDDSRSNPAIDPKFADTPSDYFWSSSEYLGSSGSAWLVGFKYGDSNNFGIGGAYRVRCVR